MKHFETTKEFSIWTTEETGSLNVETKSGELIHYIQGDIVDALREYFQAEHNEEFL